MDYPILYKIDETSFDHLGLGAIASARDVVIREVINGEYTLAFDMSREDPRFADLGYDMLVKVDGQLFRVRGIEEGRGQDGRLTASVKCSHVWYEANDCKYIPYVSTTVQGAEADGWIGVTPRWVLEKVFEDTRFTVGSVSVTETTDIFGSKTNPAAVITQMIENVGGELLRDNYEISFMEEIGNNNGVQLRVGKNLKDITRTMDDSGVVTRLYPYGRDDLDVSTVNDGKAYIDSPLAGTYSYFKEGYKDFSNIEDPQELLVKAQKEWSTEDKDGIDKPKVTYTVQASTLERVALGDRIRVIDEDLGIDVYSRVVELERYPYEPQRGSVKLSNHVDATANLMDKVVDNTVKIDKATQNDGTVKTKYVDGFRGKLTSAFNGSMAKPFVIHDYGDIWVNDPYNPTAAMSLVDGMFALANSKTAEGDWNWRILGGDGTLVADQVAADWVYAGQINADQVKAGQMEIINENTDGSKTLITPEGVKVMHSENDYTLFNAQGVRRYIDGEIAPLTWLSAIKKCCPAINSYWEYAYPVAILLEGPIWKMIAKKHAESNESLREKIFHAEIVHGTVNVSMTTNRIAGFGWMGDILPFSTEDYSDVILAPTSDEYYTRIDYTIPGVGTNYTEINGDGAVMLIGGGSWNRYLNASNVWSGSTGSSDLSVYCAGTPDLI